MTDDRQADLLSQVSVVLASELEPHLAIDRLAALLVPGLADWCLVHLVDDQERLRDIGSAHAEAGQQAVLDAFCRRIRGMRLMMQTYASQAVHGGLPIVIPEPAAASVAAVLGPGPAADLIAVLGPEHGVVVPLMARGRTLGALVLFAGPARGALDPAELEVVAEVATRAAVALDNAMLYAQQRQVAEVLQRSMLTAPPQAPGLELAVRYVPAAEDVQVGGDWYDAFVQPGGATVVTIGDVVGHDTASAAAMSHVRTLLRGIAFTTGESPARVLTLLDEAMSGLQVSTTATAVVARLEAIPGEDRMSLRWSNAGHPPPMVVHTDGTVDVLTGPRNDLLLGIDAASARAEACAVLEPGSTLLLYTDGLIERRYEAVDVGVARLRDALAGLPRVGIEQLCDRLLDALLGEGSVDDVAMIAVRILPQARASGAVAAP